MKEGIVGNFCSDVHAKVVLHQRLSGCHVYIYDMIHISSLYNEQMTGWWEITAIKFLHSLLISLEYDHASL